MQARKDRPAGARATNQGGSRRNRVRAPSAHALEREREIYDAAAQIFDRKGYVATTLNDIADAVGLLKGSLYYYIGSKEDLLYHITRVIHEGAIANLEAADAAGPVPIDRLRALIEGHLKAFEERSTLIRVFYTEYRHLSGERRAEIMGIRRRYEQYVEDLLRECQADGSICPDHDPRILGNAILTMINSAFLWYKPNRDGPIDHVARVYADFSLLGLRCPPEHDHRQKKRARPTGRGRGGRTPPRRS